MPIPKPNQGETQNEFISRFMANEAMLKEFPENEQRAAVAHSTWEASQKKDELQIHRAFSVRLDFKQDAYQETPEGYLTVDAYLTRAGIFDYRDSSGKITRELRPGEEVFDFESLKTLQLQPVTNLHPDEMITSQNIKDYQVGVTGEVIKRDQNSKGDFVKMRLKITDPVTISQVKARKDAGLPVELSCGYDAHVIPMAGEHKEGHYDAIQTQIRYNHVSIVPAGRAGEHVRLRFDKSNKEGLKVPVKFKRKAIKLDAFAMDEIDIQIPDEASAILDRLSAKLDEAIEVIQAQGNQIKEVKAQKTAAEAKIDQLSGSTKKIDELQAKLDQTTEELTKAKTDVTELSNMDSPRVQAMLKAKKDLEETADLLKVDRKDKSPKEIKIAIIKSVSPEFSHEDRSDEYINARYDSVVEFVLQARSDANNNKLGEFIKQAQDSHTPKDPRAEFIKKSQAMTAAN